MDDDVIKIGLEVDGKGIQEVDKASTAILGMEKALKSLATSSRSMATSFKSISGIGEIANVAKALEASNKLQLKAMKAHMEEMKMVVSSGFDDMSRSANIKSTGSALKTAKARLDRNLELNVKYATDTNAALLQIEEKGTSAMLTSLQRRAESIRRLLESDNPKALAIAKKRYGSDFVTTVRQGLKGELEVLAEHKETRLAMIDAMARKEAASRLKHEQDVNANMTTLASKFNQDRLKHEQSVNANMASVAEAFYKKKVAAELAARSANIGTTGRTLGGAELVGAYSPYDAMKVVPPKAKADLDDMSKGFKKLAIDGNDAHSAMRGLASGFNLLWLTWGNLAPLFAGAALSNGFVQTAKTGMEVAQTFAVIENLGGNTKTEMMALNEELTRLGKSGPFGPTEVANAMKSLSLAGLKANEILAVTQDVLNFSVAGTTSLETAATTLMTVSTAFNMGAEGFGRVSDVISKAAAESLTSVETFAEAMKTASVINSQYKVSLEDTATALAAMSQIGIQGSAAGTALRNMYSDLSGRSKEVTKVLKSQGIEMRDAATGGFRPMIEVVADLNTKLQGMTAIGQKNFLQALLSERGAKGLVEMLRLINTEAEGAGKGLSNALVTLQSSITESYGFAAVNAAKMAQTADNQFKALKATLATSMNEAYKQMEPDLLLIFDAMRRVFASPEFVQGLAAMVEGVARLGLVVAQNIEVIKAAAIAYVALKVAQMASFSAVTLLEGGKALLTAATMRSTAATVADTVAENANTAAKSGRVAGLLGLARFLPGLNVAVGVGTAAWMGYEWWRSKANDSAQEASDLYNSNVIKDLNSEADRLEKINGLRQQGLTLSQAEAKLRGEDTKALSNKSIEEKEKAAVKAWQDYNRTKAASESETRPLVAASQARELDGLRSIAASASKAVADAKIDAEESAASIERAALRVAEAQRTAAGLGKKTENSVFGNLDFDLLGKGSKTNAPALTFPKDNTLAELEKRHATQLSLFDKLEADKRSRLDARRDSEIISEGQFFGEMLTLTSEYSRKRMEVLDTNRAQYEKDYEARKKEINGAHETWKAANKDASSDDLKAKAEQTTDTLKNLSNSANSFYERLDAEKEKAGSSVFTLLQAEANKTIKQVNDLKKSTKEFWETEERSRAKAVAAQNLAESLRYADPEYAAGVLAAAEAQNRLNDEYERLTPELRKAEKALQDLIVTQLAGEDPLGGFFDSDAIAAYTAKVTLLREQMEKLKSNTGVAGAASAQAKDLFNNTERARLSESLADAVITGLTEGGESGAKAMQKILEAELSKPIKVTLQAAISSLMGGTAMASTGEINGGIIQSLSNLYDKVAGINVGAGAGNFLMGTGTNIAGKLGMGDAAQQLLGEFGAGMTNTATMQSATMAAQAGGAQLAGVIAGSVLNGVSGYGVSKALSGGFKIDGLNIDAIAGIASMIPGIGPVAGVIGGLVNRAFGRGATEVRSQGLRGNFSAGGFSGENYTNLHQQGGWFSSSRDWTETSGVDADTVKRWSTAFEGVKTAVAGSATALGLSTGLINSYTKSIDIAAGSTAETVTAIFTGMADELARALVPNIAGFAKEGESASTTLNRLAISLASVNASLAQTGQKTFAVSVAGAEAATALADLHGGLETLQSRTASYYANYFTDEERAAKSMDSMRKALATVNKTLPESKAALRGMVEGLNLKSEADRAAHVVLMAMQEEFSTAMDVRAKAAEEAAAATAKAAEEAAAAADKIKETWRSIGDSLLTEADRIRGVVAQESGYSLSYLQSKFAMLTAATRAGDQTAGGELAGVASALNDAAAAQASSALELAILRSSVANSLVRTDQIVTGGRVSVNAPILTSNTAEDTKAMRAQIEALNARINELLTNTKAENQAQFSALNRLVSILDSTTQGGTSLSVTTRNGETVKTS